MKKIRIVLPIIALLSVLFFTFVASAADDFNWNITFDTVATKNGVTVSGKDINFTTLSDPVFVAPESVVDKSWVKNMTENKISFTFNINPKIPVALDTSWYLIFSFRTNEPNLAVWDGAVSCGSITIFSDGIRLMRTASGTKSSDQQYLKGTFNDGKDHKVEITINDNTKMVTLVVDGNKTVEQNFRLLRNNGGVQFGSMYSTTTIRNYKMETVNLGGTGSVSTSKASSTSVTSSQSQSSSQSNSSSNTVSATSSDENTNNLAVNNDSTVTSKVSTAQSSHAATKGNQENSNLLIIIIVVMIVMGVAVIGFGMFIVLQSKKNKK